MKNLIIPMAGKSSRFPDMRPKWMLTHPNGNFMAIEAILGLNLNIFDNIYFITLKDHQEKYNYKKGFEENLLKNNIKASIIELENQTKDQPNTVYEAIIKENIKGEIFIKDSDNYFKCTEIKGNSICYFDLNDADIISARNKSYIEVNENTNTISNIIEKKIISSKFCIGGYQFVDASYYVDIVKKLNSLNKEFYISDVVYQMLLNNDVFIANKCTSYNDWGTLEDWNLYKKNYITLFIDLDGVIFYNTSIYLPPYIEESKQIIENVQYLLELQKQKQIEIVFTTARPEICRNITIEQLNKTGIIYKDIIMNLNHSKRIIVNDYSNTNGYKSCDSVNIERDTKNLKTLLNGII